MATIITSIFYITVLFNGSQYNLASCNDGRYNIQDIKITRMLKTKYLAINNHGENITCYYTK